MTTRHAAYLVTLADDVREDDDHAIRTALRMVSGVAAVDPVPADYHLHIATTRVRNEFRGRVRDVMRALGEQEVSFDG